ncbi:MAG: photosystem II core protein PsbZ [Synechococcaceae cyanobacterium SM2_3_1]|nr:photosystem II core protein PsbZ [Synechococcaceae cyanobacterium SM2_3_1]
MSILLQLSLLVLVLYSLIMVIAVPVLYSSSSDWSRAKNLLLIASFLWVGLVALVGGLSFLA